MFGADVEFEHGIRQRRDVSCGMGHYQHGDQSEDDLGCVTNGAAQHLVLSAYFFCSMSFLSVAISASSFFCFAEIPKR